MKVSIAMTTYNGEKFLIEQLESFAKQTVLPNEVVIMDDGSTDNTLNLINFFKETAPFDIRVYSNKTNLGYTQNFNKALQLCTNDLIFLSDQDDVWFPNKIEYMISLANLYKSKDVFMIDTELVDADLKTSGLTKQGQIKNLGLGENAFVMGCCIAVRKTFLDIILPIPKDFTGHDNWIVGLADFLQLRVIDDTVLQFYRRHGDNESNGIYNRLERTSKYSVARLINKISALFKSSRIDMLEKALYQKEFLLIGIDRLSQHFRDNNREEQLHRIRDDIEDSMKTLSKRLEIIRIDNIFTRAVKGFTLYRTREYPLKSFILDIIFH